MAEPIRAADRARTAGWGRLSAEAVDGDVVARFTPTRGVKSAHAVVLGASEARPDDESDRLQSALDSLRLSASRLTSRVDEIRSRRAPAPAVKAPVVPEPPAEHPLIVKARSGRSLEAAQSALAAGDKALALACLEIAPKGSREYAEGGLRRGLLYQRMGRPAEAAESFEAYLAQRHPTIELRPLFLELADLYDQAGASDRTLRVLLRLASAGLAHHGIRRRIVMVAASFGVVVDPETLEIVHG